MNYYSNPSVTFPTTGTSTGLTGTSNNARTIAANRCRQTPTRWQVRHGGLWH